jgi:DNA-binding XRE family transcriptional regulator
MADTPGERIAHLRAELELGQAELGRKIGKERQYVHGVERGRFVPKWATMSKFAKALKTSVNYLYGG